MLPPRYLADCIIDVWPHDNGPGTRRNDACRDGVGRTSEPARHALKIRLRPTIRSRDVVTGQTSLRGMPRVHMDHGNPGFLRLVLHKGAQLGECPIGLTRSLPPANRGPIADALEILNGQPAAGVFWRCAPVAY